MGWFEEQISKRKEYDDALFHDSLEDVSASVMGRTLYDALSQDKIYRNAIEEILHALHIRHDTLNIPDSSDIEEKYDAILRPHGILKRRVRLSKGWYKDAIGPMLTVYKENPEIAVALIPDKISGYTFVELNTGIRTRVNKKNEDLFDDYALCFYKPLPLKSLSISDLMLFIAEQFNVFDIAFFICIMAATTALGMLAPQFNYWLFGSVYESKNLTLLIALSSFILCYLICQSLLNLFSTLFKSKIGIKQKIAVEAAVMGRVISLPAAFFNKYMPGDLAQRIPYVTSLCDTLLNNIGVSIISSLFSLVYLGQIFSFAPSLTATALIIVLCTLVVSLITTFMQMHISKKIMDIQAKTSGKTYSIIKGIQKVKLTATEKRMFSLWASDYANRAKLMYNPPLFIRLSPAITLMISLIGTAIIYYIAITNHISNADYFAFNSAYAMISSAFLSLSTVATSIAQVKPMLEMIEPIMTSVPEMSENKEIINNLNGNIEISNLSFSYSPDMPKIIDDLSLKINTGEYVAIVGSTGCGKSTLLRLLLGFETPQKGAIYYDGKDFEHIDKQSLRRKLGTVMQNDKLFLGDIFSNITISAPGASMDDAWHAAEIASIADDIKALPMGMHTLISEGQGGISGGQRQRLMIARAVVGSPRILIFDEATSALDNITQKKVSGAIDKLNCTRVVVAHRLSTIRNADRIIYLDKGKIIEDGTYDELIKKDGHFAELVKRQRLDV